MRNTKLYSLNIFNFLLLVYTITVQCKVHSAYNAKQRQIAEKPWLQNISVRTPETVITTVITIPGEKIVNSELGSLSNITKLNFKFREKIDVRVPTEIKRRKIFQRQIHNTTNETSEINGLECIHCLDDGVRVKDPDCYRGVSTRTEKCTYDQECYVELRPQYIIRGCIAKNRMNRTFVCKCPLCNDKHSGDYSYYEYIRVKEWEFDNQRLQKPLEGMDLICKVCETKGTNAAADRTCRIGKNADYMVCGKNQLCYVNIDDDISFVSRGCIDRPANNSFYQFCNKTLCNSYAFKSPKIRRVELLTLCICNEEKSIQSTNSLPSFRKQIEEMTVEKPMLTKADDATNNLVSFLVNNVREIFGGLEETPLSLEPNINSDETTLPLRKTVATLSPDKEKDKLNMAIDEKEFSFDTEMDEKVSFGNIAINEKMLPKNSTKVIKTLLSYTKNSTIRPSKPVMDLTERAELLNLSKDLIILQKAEQAERENQTLESVAPLIFKKSIPENQQISITRSCIYCNNVAVMECYDPKKKLIPSHVCENEDDLCYSQHTPFGIVDRGCFNVNRNLSTFVCSCNLCNYISISEMPYIFSTKRDWIENVIELSRTKRLRQSVLKEISCLRCEVNTSTKTGDMLDNANCLEGNVGTLPIQECSENEICGVKGIRSEGYIWRGCVSKPLFNYWWTLCDSDLCNYDTLVSIYDEL